MWAKRMLAAGLCAFQLRTVRRPFRPLFRQDCLVSTAVAAVAATTEVGRWRSQRLARPGVSAEGISPLRFPNAVQVQVDVGPGLRVFALEASVDWQEELIEQAVESPEDSVEVDPFGMALWPASLVLARAVAAHAEVLAAQLREPKPRVLELGAGCGLGSLTAAILGMDVLATDFRELPLQLLHEAARRQGIAARVRTALFDVRNESTPLPEADLLIASDVLYNRETAEAVARRVAEARRGGCAVLITDIGRRHAHTFLEELRRLLPDEHADFASVGTAVVGTEHADLGSSHVSEESVGGRPFGGGGGFGPPQRVAVGVLEMPLGGPVTSLLRGGIGDLSRLVRPAGHGHVL